MPIIFSGEIYTAGNDFTRLLDVTVVTIFNAGFTYSNFDSRILL